MNSIFFTQYSLFNYNIVEMKGEGFSITYISINANHKLLKWCRIRISLYKISDSYTR